jgi:type I restriction enzyme, S subunit
VTKYADAWGQPGHRGPIVDEISEAVGAGELQRFRPYPAYKESGVEWLGRIPGHWEVKRLKHLASLNLESLSEDTDPAMEMLYVDIGGVDSLGRIGEKEQLKFGAAPTRARRLVRKGDVIVSTVRTYLRAIAPINDPEPNMVVSTGFAVVRPTRELANEYAAYALRAPYFVERVVANSTGVSFPAINESEMATFDLAVPTEQEQLAIAAFLNHQAAKIDALVAKKERLIDLLEEKRASFITSTVTKGLDPNVSVKDSGVRWLEEIPAHWEVKRLWHLTPSDRQIMYGIVLPGPNVDEGVPIVKGGDISPQRLRVDKLSRTTFEIEAGYARSRLRGGDLVYSIRGSIGEVAIVPDELEGANLTQDAARVAYTASSDGPWLLCALKAAAIFAQLEAGALGATIRGINIRDLKRALIPVPPLAEQEAIARRVMNETSKIDNLLAKIRTAVCQLQEFRTALISAAVTGKIDVREEVS